jgi:selenocysteine lyase/cysteine desulfurase
MLDAAAYVANNRLDLSLVKPDFVPISFYKMFGYPTGTGCQIIRKEAYSRLHKKWFAGGSILLVSVMKDFFAPESLGYARFEDGTVNFAMIPAAMNGIRFLETLGDRRSQHAVEVATRLFDRLSDLPSGNNSPVIHSQRGSDTVTFSIKKLGKIVDAWLFEKFANSHDVYVRTGCFCNPGVNEKIFHYTIDAYENLYNDAILPDAITIDKLREFSGEAPIGAIRASFGYANNVADADRIAEVVSNFISDKG